MKAILSLAMVALLALSVVPAVAAAGIGSTIGGDLIVEDFEPLVFQCGHRVLTDEEMQPWRVTGEGVPLFERANNYMFEGEKYQVDVLVWDKNKIEDVVVDLVLEQYGEDFSVNCVLNHGVDYQKCNAIMLEEDVPYDPHTMETYQCTFTALDSETMYGDFDIKVVADDGDAVGEYEELSPMFINPMMDIAIDGGLDFTDVRPGTSSYSAVEITSDAEGGVLLDLFITGKDWPATESAMGRCQNVDGFGNEIHGQLVNYLPLGAFRYYAEKGTYNTRIDAEINGAYSSVVRDVDAEGYVNINQQINAGFEEDMFDDAEIIQAGGPVIGPFGYRANVLTPGERMALTFRLDLPEPCYGEFGGGDTEDEAAKIFIWAEAI